MRNSARNLSRRQFVMTGSAFAIGATLSSSRLAAPVMAQDATPAASPAASPAAAAAQARSTPLMSYTFPEFPPAPMTVRMLRIVMQPGASTPMHFHPGPEFDMIESGEVVIRTNADAPVTRKDGSTETSSGDDVTLAEGDWIVYPPETGMYFSNEGDAAVTMLSAVLLPVGKDYVQSITYTDGKPEAEAFEGVSYTVLGDGLIQDMPNGETTISILTMELPAGAPLPANNHVSMYSAIEGDFSFTVDDGLVQVSRSALRALQPNAVLGQEFSLEYGDAAFFPAGVAEADRSGVDGTLRILALDINVEGDLPASPAVLTMTTGSEVATPPDDQATTDTTETMLTINEDGVNMRSEPSTSADLVDQLPIDTQVRLVSGPTEANDYTWYEVEVTDDSGRIGWVVADFLNGLPATEPTAAATPEATANAATPTANATPTASTSFAVGDQVLTVDDNVRLRPEPSTEQDAVDAFPADTQFTITGEPVTAEDFTWYPVTASWDDTISGWIPGEFLKPAE